MGVGHGSGSNVSTFAKYANAHGEILTWRNHNLGRITGAFHIYGLPVSLFLTIFVFTPSAWEFFTKMFPIWALLAGAALTMNHRFFAHQAFKTSRVFRFVCGIVSCLGLQWGPLWWSSKHRRHHKVCDLPGDPHSWVQTNFWHAWFGWTMAHEEQQIDVAYLHPSLMTDKPLFYLPKILCPLQSFGEMGSAKNLGGVREQTEKGKEGGKVVATELLLLDRFWLLPCVVVHLVLFLYCGWSFRDVFIFYTAPSLHIPLPILLFNVTFHPPDTTPTKVGCFALDNYMDPLTFLFGESAHEDHHKFPARARRPGLFDLSWLILLKPLLAVGLIWDPKTYGENKAK